MLGITRSALTLLAGLVLALPAAAQTATPATPATKPTASAPAASPAPLLDINTASVADLQALKGIGDKRAADIVKNRPYKGKDDLVQKKIIPAAVYADIKDKIIARQK